MRKIELGERGDVAARLRPDEFQFVAAPLDQFATRLGADADPVDAARNGEAAVGSIAM